VEPGGSTQTSLHTHVLCMTSSGTRSDLLHWSMDIVLVSDRMMMMMMMSLLSPRGSES
jgi:hypothetical protein